MNVVCILSTYICLLLLVVVGMTFVERLHDLLHMFMLIEL
jgi:hypothetical protein